MIHTEVFPDVIIYPTDTYNLRQIVHTTLADGNVLIVVFFIIVLFGLVEALSHKQNLSKLPIRIHVNSTRGKSSVAFASFPPRASGRQESSPTGTLARMILADASEYSIFRPCGANIIEQVRIVSIAASLHVQAIVLECMAL